MSSVEQTNTDSTTELTQELVNEFSCFEYSF